MTYPAVRYEGPDGETSATYRPASQPPDLTYANGTTVHYLAGGRATDGLFGLYRWEMGAAVSGPDAHFHRTITESFYILTGSVRIFDGRSWLETGTGDFVHVPAGGLHGFRNESGAPATMLLHFAPGAPREGYFEGLAAFATKGRPSKDALETFYREHDNHWR